MEWRRHSSAVVSLALLASVVGHFVLQRQFELRYRSLVADLQSDGHLKPASPLMASDDMMPSAIPRFLDQVDRPRRVEQILPALQIREDGENDGTETRPSRPQPVPEPQDAAPLADSNGSADSASGKPSAIADDNAVRRVIDEELLGSSREERDIWYDELKSIPAGVVRDLLQVRKQLRSLPRALHKADAPAPPPATVATRATEISAEPASQTRRQPLPDWTLTLAALEQATSLSRHNVANSISPGFKRIRWHLVDAYDSTFESEADDDASLGETARISSRVPIRVEGCRLATPLLDLKAGTLLNTGRPLDLAIDGDGFFAVNWHEKQVYTRCGAIVLDSQRRLSLCVADGSAVLQPPITIPDDATEIQISAQGDVHVLRASNSNLEVLGQIQLARFVSPERLRPIGATLLAATGESGVADMGEPDAKGRGVIQQGCLEQSNVDVEAELADIERLQSLTKSLPLATRPVTASGKPDVSR